MNQSLPSTGCFEARMWTAHALNKPDLSDDFHSDITMQHPFSTTINIHIVQHVSPFIAVSLHDTWEV
jgi:hypothetical protein